MAVGIPGSRLERKTLNSCRYLLFQSHYLTIKAEFVEKKVFVLNKSYGLDGKKWSANDIAAGLDIKGVSAYVRVSELKKQAVNKLIDNVDHSQVLDYL